MGTRRVLVASVALFALLEVVGSGRAANGRATLLPATRQAEEYEERLKHEVEQAERLRLLSALVECYRGSAENEPRAGARDSAWQTFDRLRGEFPQALETLEAGLGLARLNVRLLARSNGQECNQHLYGQALSCL